VSTLHVQVDPAAHPGVQDGEGRDISSEVKLTEHEANQLLQTRDKGKNAWNLASIPHTFSRCRA